MKYWATVLCLLGAACSDLSHFVVEEDTGVVDAGAPDTLTELDAGFDADPTPTDGGPDAIVDSGSDAPYSPRDGGVLGDCPMPQLLVGVSGTDDDGHGRGGRVLRFSVGEEVTRCGDVTVDGRFSSNLTAMGFIAPDSVVVGGDRGVIRANIETDTTEWEHQLDPFSAFSISPRSTFALEESGHASQVAMAFTYIAADEIAMLKTFDDSGEYDREWDVRDSSFPLDGNAIAMEGRPHHPSQLLALTSDGRTIELDPFSGMAADELFVPAPSSAELRSLHAFDDSVLIRLSWAGGTASDDGAFYIDDFVGDTATNPPFGPIGCRGRGESTHVCSLPEYTYDAIADPTQPGRFFAICSGGGFFTRHLVRYSTDRSDDCEVVMNQGELEEGLQTFENLSAAVR